MGLAKFAKLVVTAVFAVFCGLALAENYYDGWGTDPEKALEAAIARAKKDSPAGCICKNWSANMETMCKKGKPELGGFVCTACGSKHNGSCESQAEIDRVVRDISKLKSLQ